jgi:hypothetical protein
MGNRLLAWSKFNPKGYFEDYDMVRLNVDLVGSADVGSVCPTGLGPQEKFRAYVVYRDNSQFVWGVKDPRLCITGPLLLEALAHRAEDVRIVVAHRGPDACIQSLANRDDLTEDVARGQFLHLLAGLGRVLDVAETHDMLVHTVSFERLVDPATRESVILDLADFVLDFTRPLVEAAAFVDPTLVHYGEESQ